MDRRVIGTAVVVFLLAAGGVYAATSLSTPGSSTTPETTTTAATTTTVATTTASGTDSTTTTTDADAIPATPNASITDPSSSDLVLRPAVDQVVGGETNLPAGADLVVRMRSSGSSPFLKSTEVEVRENGRFVAPFDLANVPSGAEFDVVVRFNGTRLDEASGVVRVENPEARLSYEGDALTLVATSGQVVRGETSLPPDSEITVRLRSTDSAQPFIKQQGVSVRQNGTFAATFNMSRVDPGTEFEVSVRHLGDTVTTAPGNVTATTN